MTGLAIMPEMIAHVLSTSSVTPIALQPLVPVHSMPRELAHWLGSRADRRDAHRIAFAEKSLAWPALHLAAGHPRLLLDIGVKILEATHKALQIDGEATVDYKMIDSVMHNDVYYSVVPPALNMRVSEEGRD